jgi:hypothetical protein
VNNKAKIKDESVDVYVCAIVVSDVEYVNLGLRRLIFSLVQSTVQVVCMG